MSIEFLYRATSVNSDVWENLSRNWDRLTGEFPHTLQKIVEKIETRLFLRNYRGPQSLLSVHNQVKKIVSIECSEKKNASLSVFCNFLLVRMLSRLYISDYFSNRFCFVSFG